MILDYTERGTAEKAFQYGKVLIDGAEIRQVWYIDTDAGIVKTYDVLGDGKAHVSRECLALEGHPGIDLPIDGVASKTLTGKVELFFADGSAYAA